MKQSTHERFCHPSYVYLPYQAQSLPFLKLYYSTLKTTFKGFFMPSGLSHRVLFNSRRIAPRFLVESIYWFALKNGWSRTYFSPFGWCWILFIVYFSLWIKGFLLYSYFLVLTLYYHLTTNIQSASHLPYSTLMLCTQIWR